MIKKIILSLLITISISCISNIQSAFAIGIRLGTGFSISDDGTFTNASNNNLLPLEHESQNLSASLLFGTMQKHTLSAQLEINYTKTTDKVRFPNNTSNNYGSMSKLFVTPFLNLQYLIPTKYHFSFFVIAGIGISHLTAHTRTHKERISHRRFSRAYDIGAGVSYEGIVNLGIRYINLSTPFMIGDFKSTYNDKAEIFLDINIPLM